ncbi:MAG: hypothetical protein KME15_27755 [Drouetiella hepatica Uher 2000/2452]|uniref:Uncharacterized protein n=1 Tax=Drouetiella hepatica Uher 2000/2452 TaxID=904376 RepID=A0A951QIM6_9CYAN|nr:hypothetical protein [Drouetiella hepatica Uher 2000/2452]
MPVKKTSQTTVLEPVAAQSSDLISAYAEPIAEALIRDQLPGAIHQHIQRILTSDKPEDRAKLQGILQQIGVVIAAQVLKDCLVHASTVGQAQLMPVDEGKI